MESQPEDDLTRPGVIKNVVVLCAAFFIAFTAYDCLGMLQSTLNHEQGIGVGSQSIIYGCFCVSSLLFPKYVIQKVGSKRALVLSMCFYVPYIASNLYPHWSVMVPAAIFNGLSASLLWGSQCTYLNDVALMYALQSADAQIEEQDHSAAVGVRRLNYDSAKREITTPTETSHDDSADGCTFSRQSVRGEIQERYSGRYVRGKESITSSSSVTPGTFKSLDTESKLSYAAAEFSPPVFRMDPEAAARPTMESVNARFFGIHGMAYLSTHMCSNLMSYFILQNDVSLSNATLNTRCVCGAQFCNGMSDCSTQNLQEPSRGTRYFLTGLCVALGLIAILVLSMFLDPLNDKKEKVTLSLKLLMATCRHSKKKLQILLIPLTYYVGMMQGFYSGDFTMSFVGCAWGTYHVSLVAACYGAACAVSSPLAGLLVRRLGRIPLFLTASLINASGQILLLMWQPTAEEPALFFLVAGMWGSSLGIFWSQLKAMYGFLFKKDEEAAFAAYHLWYSLGFCLSFAYSNHLCTYLKIYILMSVLILGMMGYLWVELDTRRRTNPKAEKSLSKIRNALH